MRRVAAAALLLALVGCSDRAADETSSAGGDCDEAFHAAATAVLRDDRLGLLTASLTACRDVEEWTATSRRHPAALEGLDAATWLAEACAGAPQAPVCAGRR